MELVNISASTRVCTVAEMQALSLWSAAYLPHCRSWAAKRGLQPPIEIIEMLQKIRFDVPLLAEMRFESLFALASHNRPAEGHAEYLEKVATDLAHHLQQIQELLLPVNTADQQYFLTAARDLRRFQRALLQLQCIKLELVAGEPMIVSLFAPQRMTLYIPRWLIDVLPQTVFEPNQSFYRPRRASLMWLLFDAIVITNTYEFKTI